MEKSKQLGLFIEEKIEPNKVYYNGLGEPLPWEIEQAIREGYKPKEVNSL